MHLNICIFGKMFTNYAQYMHKTIDIPSEYGKKRLEGRIGDILCLKRSSKALIKLLKNALSS